MKVYIRDIRPQGLQLHEEITPQTLELGNEDIKVLSLLLVEAKLQRVDNVILANVDVTGTYAYNCARCLEPVEQKRLQHVDLDYEITPTTEFIELDDDIRQELIMAYSPIVLCKKNCKGICPNCGANLNVEKCSCENKK